MSTPYEDCLAWVREREAIRLRKERGLPPQEWTEDDVLAKYRFCNVRREDDRVTRWIHENIRVPFERNHHLWFMLCAARQINWPPTLEALIRDAYGVGAPWPNRQQFTPEDMAKALNLIAADGHKVFTGAYIITAPSTKGAKKTDHVALKTLGRLWADRDRIGRLFDPQRVQPRMEEVHAKLMQYDGWGPFMAYQAVVDMRFTRLLSGASDVTTWAAAGPGTIRGLNRLSHRQLSYPLDQYAALKEMRLLWPRLTAEAGVEMDFSDVPNVLCETDKYLRVKNGEGKPRALYVPGRGS